MVDIRVTDLTEMNAGNFCLAGWDQAGQRMVRPLPNGGNWTMAMLQHFGIVPGSLLRITPSGNANGEYPHLTEDTRIELGGITSIPAQAMQWFGPNAPTTAATVADAFQGQLQHNKQFRGVNQGNYVARGTHSRSLWGVTIPRANISFSTEFEKLKATVVDASGAYQLAVSSHALKAIWRNGGVQAIQRALPQSGQLHVRVGLARAYNVAPDRCSAMVNGVYW